MRIASLDFEIVRATPAVAEFLVRVHLDQPGVRCDVTGRTVGPRCPGTSTIEVSYSMMVVETGDGAASLRCVIPEPSLWTPGSPFEYIVSITLTNDDELVDSRSGTVRLRRAI